MVLVDGAGEPIGGAHRFEDERGQGRIARHLVGEAIHRGDVGTESVELALGVVPLRDEHRVTGRRAELQARVDRRDGAVIAARVLGGGVTDLLKLAVAHADLPPQRVELSGMHPDLLPDERSGRRELGGRRRLEAGRTEDRRWRRRRERRRRLLGFGCGDLDLLGRGPRRLRAGERRPQRIGRE